MATNAAEGGRQRRSTGESRTAFRVTAAVTVLGLVAGYLIAVLAGWVAGSRKLSLTEIALALIAIGVATALVEPKFLQAISLFEFGGLKVELRQIKEGQLTQAQQLDDMKFLILLLMGEKQKKYLIELSTGAPARHDGDIQLRDALRNLRAAGLIKMKGDHHVRELKDGVRNHDITELVEITEDGRTLAERIRPR